MLFSFWVAIDDFHQESRDDERDRSSEHTKIEWTAPLENESEQRDRNRRIRQVPRAPEAASTTRRRTTRHKDFIQARYEFDDEHHHFMDCLQDFFKHYGHIIETQFGGRAAQCSLLLTLVAEDLEGAVEAVADDEFTPRDAELIDVIEDWLEDFFSVTEKYGYDDEDDAETVDALRRSCGLTGQFLTLAMARLYDVRNRTGYAEKLAEVYRNFILIDLVRMTHLRSSSSKVAASNLIVRIDSILSTEPSDRQLPEACDQCVSSLLLLDLSGDVGAGELNSAHRDMVKVWHPDRFSEDDKRLKKMAEERFKRIQAAFEHLQLHRGQTGEISERSQ